MPQATRTSPPEVPPDQRHLPRAQRQHPFRFLPTEQHERDRIIADVLAGVKNMVLGAAVNCMTKQERRYRSHWKHELAADIEAHLAGHSLPLYDAWRVPRVKVTSFISVCAHNQARARLRTLRRQDKAAPLQLLEGFDAPAPDQQHDRRIEALATAIIADPGAFGFTAGQSRVIQTMARCGPGTEMQELARQLGYARPSSFSMILRRIRLRIAELAREEIENGEADPPQQYRLETGRRAMTQRRGEDMADAA
jgi:hypothetical protein